MSDREILSSPLPSRRLRPLMLVGGAAVTAALLGLALYLGAWAFAARSASLHERRLSRLLEQKPHREQVAEALRAEGMRLVGEARSPAELAPLVERWGAARRAAILDRTRPWPLTSVFTTDGVAYFLSFDSQDQLRAFAFSVR